MAGRRNATRKEVGLVRDLGRDGAGVVATEGGVVFVAGALPGERVRFSVAGKRRGVQRGRLLEVLEPSPDRVEAPCSLAPRCGGCPLMILRPEAQREHKAQVASRATGTTTEVARGGSEGSDLGYRQRARLAFAADGGPGSPTGPRRGTKPEPRRRAKPGGRALGYRESQGRKVIDVEACPVLVAELDAALGHLRSTLLPGLAGRGEIQLAMGAGAPVAWIRAEAPQSTEVYDGIARLVEEGALAGAVLSVDEATPARWGDPREHNERQGGEPVIGAPFGFSQANGDVNRALVAQVVEWADPRGMRVVELYSGHGNLSVELGEGAKSLLCVEESPDAGALCRENIASRGLEARVLAMDAADGAGRHRGPADVVVLDPPRTGARDAIAAIVALAPVRIIYVSCDPPTLARDLGMLREQGYRVTESVAFDMFPHTAHVEVVVHLTRDLGAEKR